MLVLSRKKNESIHIGDEVLIRVLTVKGGGVRIGIEAPDHISIVRGELLPADSLDVAGLESGSSQSATGSPAEIPVPH